MGTPACQRGEAVALQLIDEDERSGSRATRPELSKSLDNIRAQRLLRTLNDAQRTQELLVKNDLIADITERTLRGTEDIPDMMIPDMHELVDNMVHELGGSEEGSAKLMEVMESLETDRERWSRREEDYWSLVSPLGHGIGNGMSRVVLIGCSIVGLLLPALQVCAILETSFITWDDLTWDIAMMGPSLSIALLSWNTWMLLTEDKVKRMTCVQRRKEADEHLRTTLYYHLFLARERNTRSTSHGTSKCHVK